MLNPDQSEYFDVIVLHATSNLPDSVERRRKLLHALISVLPDGYARKQDVAEMLAHLHLHILAQRDLPMKIEQRTPQPSTNGEPQP